MVYKLTVLDHQNIKKIYYYNDFDDIVTFLAKEGIVIPSRWNYNDKKELVYATWKHVDHHSNATMEVIE